MNVPARIGRTRIDRWPLSVKETAAAAVTLGRFDGVHTGHQALLRATLDAARATPGMTSVALTFWPPPEWILRPAAPRRLLTTLEDRLRLMAAAGLDRIVVWPFDAATAALSPYDFLHAVRDALDMRTLLTGPNARIGKDRTGTPEIMAAAGAELGFAYRPISWQGTPGATASSHIRALLAGGDLGGVNRALGRLYSFEATVTRGAERGRTLGFPTANLRPPDWLAVPAFGIYAGVVNAEGRPQRAVVNIGVRPTFGPGERLIEVHVLEFAGDLYGQPLRLFLQARLREEQRFPTVEALRQAIRADVETAAALAWPEARELAPFVDAAPA
ncbi:MAG: riboflavin biosynthesis protein RibF [Actinobacteria bacterium]|nr:riboflavin biosynthesis protein RibF [Actinomycetota bacterium]